jgi:uncharacterized protein (TIGR02588 family)
VSERQPEATGTPVIERILAGMGLLVLAVIVGALLREAMQPDDRLPLIDARIEEVARIDAGWVVLVAVRNRGGAGAIDVTLEARQATADGRSERYDVVLAELPARSERRIGLVLDRHPDEGRIEIRARSFTEP